MSDKINEVDTEDELRQAFDKFDVRNDGTIEVEEI